MHLMQCRRLRIECRNKTGFLNEMGRDVYIECHSCQDCQPSQDIVNVPIQGYKEELPLCQTCLNNPVWFTQEPSEFVLVPDAAFEFHVPGYQTLDKKPVRFISLAALRTFVGKNETNISFGIVNDKDGFITTDFDALFKRCERLVWESDDHDADNTDFKPTAEWWRSERSRVEHEVKTWTKRRKIIKDSF